MSIRTAQTERLLQDIVRTLYSQGVQPTLGNILGKLSQYFAEFPPGLPLPIPVRGFANEEVSNVDEFNEALSFVAINLDVLYEVALDQIQDVLLLTDSLQSYIKMLSAHRRRIETTIDDYLLSLFNTDGYYYSLSDTFSDTSLTELSMTSAQIDPETGMVILPTVSSKTRKLGLTSISAPSIVVNISGTRDSYPWKELAPYTGAIEDSLSNMIWAFEVETTVPTEVIAYATFPLGENNEMVSISRIDLTPYGTLPLQLFVEVNDSNGFTPFGNSINTSVNKMTFGSSVINTNAARFTMRKTEPDYVDTSAGAIKYRYIFGAKDISFISQIYDSTATFVSVPLSISPDLASDVIIDAISLVTEDDIPPDTTLTYSVAISSGDEDSIDDFNWQPILPISSGSPGNKIIRFNGASISSKKITSSPIGSDLQLIPLSTSGAILDRNPTPGVVAGVDIYRVAKFNEDVLINSLSLLEGVNTIKIYHRAFTTTAITSGLDYWSLLLDDSHTDIVYGRIDAGNQFFYGGDIGESGRSIYLETFIDCAEPKPTFLADFQKSDPNSQLWDIKIFLNGREIGYLPAGVNRSQIPWGFTEGVNHVALIINIPTPTVSAPNPYIGAVNLMGDLQLYSFGTVRLASWSYVDLFTMQYSQSGQPTTFTIYNGEIVSRRKPTDNFALKYALSTGHGPEAVRLRADMTRLTNNPYVSPKLMSYRMQFLYGPED